MAVIAKRVYVADSQLRTIFLSSGHKYKDIMITGLKVRAIFLYFLHQNMSIHFLTLGKGLAQSLHAVRHKDP